MSDRVAQSYEDGDGSSGRQYQSLWMAHWTRTGSSTAPQSINHSYNPFGNKLIENDRKETHLLSSVGIESDFSRSAKRFKEVEVRTTELVNETILKKEQHNHRWPFQYPRQKNLTMLPNIPSTSKNPSPFSGREMIELENLHRKVPQSVHDVETMRIISQTTHSFLITKKTDVSLYNNNQFFRESRVSTQLTGNAIGGGNYSLAPLFGHGRAGVKLQSICNSTDSDREEDISRFKALQGKKTELSTETNSMDMDSFKEEKNHAFGAYALTPKKVIIADPSVSPQQKITSAEGKVRYNNRKTELPDINVELTAPSEAACNSMENTEPSTSKTLSLDMEILFPPANPTNPKPKQSQSGSLGPDPNIRWLKRLKSNSGPLGTKSSKLGETSSGQMKNMFFGKTTKDSISNTDLTLGNGGSKKERDITLDHPWIQRWRRNRGEAPQKKRKAEDSGLQKSREALEYIEKKQFPSIAAMALMGKAMTGFQPCELKKRGSFLVWNTKSF